MDEEINWRVPSENRSYYLDLEYQGRIWVDEKIYKEYQRSKWSEEKKIKRRQKCLVDIGGKLKRCPFHCQTCSQDKTEIPLSLDALYEEYQFEFPSEENIVLEELFKEERNQKIRQAILRLSKTERKMILLFLQGFSERKIAQILQKSSSTIHYQKKKIFAILRKELEEYFKSF